MAAMQTRVLVVAAHPDDEVLGCGATLAMHAQAGDAVFVLFLSEGVSSRSVPGIEHDWLSEIKTREAMAHNAARILGYELVGFLRYPNLRMRNMEMLDIVKQVDSVVRKVGPSIIYTHHPGDLNSDHGVAFEATLTACRPRPGLSVHSIYTFEVPSSTEWSSPLLSRGFHPQHFVSITQDFFNKKLLATTCYDHEMRCFPHPRSETYLRALANIRGSSVGIELAEGFMVIREVRI